MKKDKKRKIATRIMAGILAGAMVLGTCATLIFVLLAK